MTTHRARAYKRVTRLVADLGTAKLHVDERQAIRDAADAMLFAPEVASHEEAGAAMREMTRVVARLVGADRILPETAERIVDGVEACGPQRDLQAAA